MTARDSESSETIPRWLVIIIIEAWAIAHCFIFTGYGAPGFLMSHLWAAIYSVLGIFLARKKEWSTTVDGFPLWSYWLAIVNHFLVLPILFACSLLTAPCLKTWLHEGFKPTDDVFAANIFYCIIGCMIKDTWLIKEHPRTMTGIGYLFHHIFTISGCAVSLSLDAAAGVACVGAVIMEFASGIFDLHVVLQKPRTLVTYLCTMPVSNIFAALSTFKIWSLARSAPIQYKGFNSELYIVIAALIIFVRQYAWVIQVRTEWQAVKLDADKALLSRTFLKNLF